MVAVVTLERLEALPDAERDAALALAATLLASLPALELGIVEAMRFRQAKRRFRRPDGDVAVFWMRCLGTASVPGRRAAAGSSSSTRPSRPNRDRKAEIGI
jgi:hypothetical protein